MRQFVKSLGIFRRDGGAAPVKSDRRSVRRLRDLSRSSRPAASPMWRALCRPSSSRKGIAITSLVPGYPPVLAKLARGDAIHAVPGSVRRPGPAVARATARRPRSARDRRAASVRRGPALPISTPEGEDWPDNALRFAALARGRRRRSAWARSRPIAPDIVHAHDWQAGLTPAYLHYRGTARPAPARS